MRLTLTLVLVFVFSGLLAQTGMGVKGGLNYSGVRTDNQLIVDNQPKLGWQAGVFVKSLNEGWGFWAESYINVVGSKQQFGDESQKNTIGYLSIPIALHYATASNFSFYFGGYASMRLWATRKSTKVGVGDFESNIKDNVAFFDFGPWVGVSYTYNKFLFDIRYLHGIPNVNTNAQINAKTTPQVLSSQLPIT